MNFFIIYKSGDKGASLRLYLEIRGKNNAVLKV